ncbi:hypothetical protein D3C72_1391110 [compost metagenome]
MQVAQEAGVLRRADKAVVHQAVAKMRMHARAQRLIAGEVDIERGLVHRHRCQFVIGDGAAVAAEVFDKGAVAGRGQPGQRDAVEVAQAEGGAIGRLAGGAGHHQPPCAEEAVVFQEVGQHERGDEQRPVQHLVVLQFRRVGGVVLHAGVLVVGRGQLCAVRRGIVEAARGDALGLHADMAGDGEVAIEAFARGDAVDGGRDYIGEAPHRHVAPLRLARGEELPILHGLAKGGVGDVVGGQRKAVQAQQHFAGSGTGGFAGGFQAAFV